MQSVSEAAVSSETSSQFVGCFLISRQFGMIENDLKWDKGSAGV